MDGVFRLYSYSSQVLKLLGNLLVDAPIFSLRILWECTSDRTYLCKNSMEINRFKAASPKLFDSIQFTSVRIVNCVELLGASRNISVGCGKSGIFAAGGRDLKPSDNIADCVLKFFLFTFKDQQTNQYKG